MSRLRRKIGQTDRRTSHRYLDPAASSVKGINVVTAYQKRQRQRRIERRRREKRAATAQALQRESGGDRAARQAPDGFTRGAPSNNKLLRLVARGRIAGTLYRIRREY